MINKNQWSLINYSERDINTKILSINPIPHSEQDFTHLLADKEQYQRESAIPRPQELLRILNCKVNKLKHEETSSLCSSCLEQLNNQKHWCRICGGQSCKKCLIRERQLKDQTRTFFCQKCDNQYLRAMSNITFYNQVQEYQRSFLRLVREQESIEELVNLERTKLKGKGQNNPTAQLIQKTQKSSRLTEENKVMKIQCQQLQKKVEFGRNIHRQLKKKLHKLRKLQRESFGTISNTDSYHNQIEPPKIQENELNISVDHINNSMLTSLPENEQEGFSEFGKKCKCQIY